MEDADGRIQNMWNMLTENSDEQKENESPVRKSGRKSWFDTPRSTKLEIAVEKKKRRSPGSGNSKNKRKSEEMETLLLTHFTNPPHIEFGKVRVKNSRTRHLVLKNPHDYEQEVVIEKFPYKKKFSVDETKLLVGPDDSEIITITWCPEESGRCREMLLFKVDGLYRLQAFLLGSAEPEKQVRKGPQRKGILGTKVKRPFSILHTPGLACIRDNYSPQDSSEKPRWKQEREPLSKNHDQANKYREKDAAFSPPTLESTVISKPVDAEMCRSVKMSDLGCSPSLLTSVSPIAHAPDDNYIFDSYSAVRQTSPLTEICIDGEVGKQGNNFSELCESGPKLSFDTPIKDTASACKVEENGITTPYNDTENLDNQNNWDVKKYISPESFLNDSLCVKSSAVGNVESSQLYVPPEDRFAKVIVSPNSFLEDLNASIASKDGRASRYGSEIPSPSSLLNDSIPHNVMLKQLSTVRTSLIGQNNKRDERVINSTEEVINIFCPSGPTLTSTFSLFQAKAKTGGKQKSLSRSILRKEQRFAKISDVLSPRRTTYLVKNVKGKEQKQTKNRTLSRTQKYTNIHKAGVKGVKKAQQEGKDILPNELDAADSLATTPKANKSGSETVSKLKQNDILNLSGSDTVIKMKHKAPLNLSGSETVTKKKHSNIQSPEMSPKEHYTTNNCMDTPELKVADSPKVTKAFTITTADGKITSVKRLFADQLDNVETENKESSAVPKVLSETVTITKNVISPSCCPFVVIGSPQTLPDSPVTTVNTHTITKLRTSDALLQAYNRTVQKELFQKAELMTSGEEHHCVKSVEKTSSDLEGKTYCLSASETKKFGQVINEVTCTKMLDKKDICYSGSNRRGSTQDSKLTDIVSPVFTSSSQTLPNSPVLEHSRRSTHVISKPKLLNPNASGRRLFPALSDRETHDQPSFTVGLDAEINNTPTLTPLEDSQLPNKEENQVFESTRIDSNPRIIVTPPCVSLITDPAINFNESRTVQNTASEFTESLTLVNSEKQTLRCLSKSHSNNISKPSPNSETKRRKMKASRRSSEISADMSNKTAFVSSSLTSECESRNLLNTTKGSRSFMKSDTSDFRKRKSDLKPAAPKSVQKKTVRNEVVEGQSSKQNKLEKSSSESGKKKGLLWKLSSAKKKRQSLAVAQPKLILIKKSKSGMMPKHPMPFAAKNIYYDERWKDKQDRGFVKWLNFILTPADEYNYSLSKTKVDVGSIAVSGNKDGSCRAPTKEVLSFRAYAARRRLNRLRRAACRLYQSEEIVTVILKIEVEVERLGLAVRKDRMLHADIGIKQRILDMLLCYNPLWLRIGLETVFGEVLPLQSNTDVVGMSRFILYRLVDSPDIARQFSHPTVPHLYRDGYAEAVAQHTLKKFLMVVFFLDRAKTSRLIDHDPCLFCKDADIKASKDLLVCFSRDYLSGEGDITRHLSYLGYTVTHSQTAMDEFDYSVTNLGVDLRDGFRLMRVLEFLIGEWNLMNQLRGPAISRLQKLHNVNMVFKTLSERGLDMAQVEGGQVTARDVVDGHREKTLKLLWYIIFHFQVDILINKEELIEEIKYLERSLRIKISMQKLLHINQENIARRDSGEKNMFMENERLALLLQWTRTVCLHYGVKVENFTVSFSDGRALCCLVHHYHPGLLPLDCIHMNTSQSYQQKLEDEESKQVDANLSQGDDLSFVELKDEPQLFDTLVDNERKNFKLLYEKMSELGGVPLMLKSTDMTNTIPDEKVVITYVTYLCSRLLDIRHESRAARVIQAAWRNYILRRMLKVREKEEKAAKTIQLAVQLFLKRKKNQQAEKAAILIQSLWRQYRARLMVTCLKTEKENEKITKATERIQAAVKAYLARKHYQKKCKAIVTLQAGCRAFLVRREMKKKNMAAKKIQNFYLGCLETRHLQRRFVKLRKTAIVLQRIHRTNRNRKHTRRLQAAVCIQKHWRRFRDRRNFCHLRKAAVITQKCYRMKKRRQNFLKLKKSTLTIQQRYRAKLTGAAARSEYILIHSRVCKLQAHIRGFIERKRYKAVRQAAVFVQKNFRRYKSRIRYQATKLAAVIIQRAYRTYRLKCLGIQKEKEYTAASICIQRWWRRQRQIKVQRQKMAILKLQASWRGYRERKNFRISQQAAIVVQSWVRGFIARRRFVRTVSAVIVLQHHVRNYLMYKHSQAELLRQTSAAVLIQKTWRMRHARMKFKREHNAVMVLQKNFAMMVARKHFQEKRKAALILQKHFRKLLVVKATKKQEARKRSAAIAVQSWWRGIQDYKRFSRNKHSALVIQRWYRQLLAQKRHETEIRAAVIIQQRYRALQSGRRVRRNLSHMNQAATVIQRRWRGIAAKSHYCRVKKSVIILQTYVRMWLARKQFKRLKESVSFLQQKLRAYLEVKRTRENYLSTRNKVIKLQAAVRSWKCRRIFTAKRRAAIVIQSYVRMYLHRQKYERILAAVIIIQLRFRCHQSAKGARKDFLAARKGIICLQSHIRRRIQTNYYQKKRKAIVKLQSYFRMVQKRQMFNDMKMAAICIQTHYRSQCLVKQERNAFLQKRSACLIIQHAFRGYVIRKIFLKFKHSAIILQSYIRMRHAQKCYTLKRNAVITIQQKYRLFYQVQKARQEFLHIKRSVLTIQAAFRRYLVRCRIEKMHRAALTIQSHYRMYAARKEYHSLRNSTLTIQKFYRQYREARWQRVEFLKQKHAALVIQCHLRGLTVRREMKKMHAAAVKIQSSFRSHQQRCHFLALKRAALVCQRFYRARQLSQHQRRFFLIQVGAAVTIQASYRAYIIRKQYLNKYRKIQLLQASARTFIQQKKYRRVLDAARTIQKCYRAHQTAVTARKRYLEMRAAAVVLQRAFRSVMSIRKERRERAAICIQSCIRMWKERSRFRRVQKATVCIQSLARGFLARRLYQKKQEAIRLIQRNIRVYILINSFQREISKRKTAACVIQRAYRQYRVHKEVKRNTAALCIQANVRMYLSRKKFLKIRQLIISLQSVARGSLVRRMVKKKKLEQRAAITLQREFRRHMEAKRLKVVKEKRQAYIQHFVRVTSLHLAAVTVQRCYRKHRIIMKAKQKLHSVIVIQRFIRASCARLKFVRLRKSVVVIQRKVREWMQQRDCAARVIQRNVLHWLSVTRQKHLHERATSIQAAWKGYSLRKRIKCKQLQAARKRIEEANNSATEEKKLGNRTTSALDYLLRYHQLSYILEALIHLDVATRLSPRCCERLVEVNAVHVIYRLIQSCNRSLPHMELIKYAVNVLLNLVKYEKTRAAVYDIEDAAVVLVDLIAVYRDKGIIFNKACTLLGVLALDENNRQDIISRSKVVEKIQTIHFLTMRKHSIEEAQRIRRAKLAAQKTFNSTLPLPTPTKHKQIRPAWVLRRNSFEGIQDPLMAINFVMDNLHLKPKRV